MCVFVCLCVLVCVWMREERGEREEEERKKERKKERRRERERGVWECIKKWNFFRRAEKKVQCAQNFKKECWTTLKRKSYLRRKFLMSTFFKALVLMSNGHLCRQDWTGSYYCRQIEDLCRHKRTGAAQGRAREGDM